MNTRSIFILITITLMVLAGCGGSSGDKSTAASINFTVLQAEGDFLVEGTVYNDLNGDGIMDVGEAGIAGVTVALTDNDNNVLDTAATDAGGTYAFAVLTEGTYKVFETDPAGYVSTTPNEVVFEIVDANVTVNFGDMALVPTWSVYGTVFDDMNQNGVMDMGEVGVEGVTVTLSGMGDITTDAVGVYAFAVNTAGPYMVGITEPAGYALTTANPVDITVTDADVQVDFGLHMYMDTPVDVKPGSDVNPVNLRSNGVLPVAVLGSADFDVTTIDPSTILLNGVAPLRWSIADVCGPSPYPQDPAAPMMDDNEDMEMPDGYDDLTLKFSTPEIAASLGEVARGDIVTLYFSAETTGGITLTGEEDIRIVQIPK
jgi:hypothetical protein